MKVGDLVRSKYDPRYQGSVEKVRKSGLLIRWINLATGKPRKNCTIMKVHDLILLEAQ